MTAKKGKDVSRQLDLSSSDQSGRMTLGNYPEPSKILKNPGPVNIECTSNQIVPDRIRIDPTQGLVFTFKTASRIKIDLVKPEDRQSRLRMKRLHAREEISGQKKGEKKLVRRYRLMPSGARI